MARCNDCQRRFRSKQAYELYQRRVEVLKDLRATCGPKFTYSSTPDLSKRERHLIDSSEHRAGMK